jgi:hypothetical protein
MAIISGGALFFRGERFLGGIILLVYFAILWPAWLD